MGEPLTISLAVVGLLKATYTVSSILTNFTKKAINAPNSARRALSEVNDVNRTLRQLQAYLDGTTTAPQSRASLLTLKDIVATLTECVTSVSELETILPALKTDGMGTLDKVKWMWNEGKIMKILDRVQYQKISLNFMFTILTCQTQEAALDTAGQLSELVRQMLANNQELSARIEQLESAAARRNSLFIHPEDDASTIMPGRRREVEDDGTASIATKDGSTLQHPTIGFAFENFLQATRVYKRALKNDEELFSAPEDMTVGFSMLSGLSVSEISNISIFALPVTIFEIANADHYTANLPLEAGVAISIGPDTTPSATPGGNTSGAASRSPPSPSANNVHRVRLDFKPSMDDEIELCVGQRVRVLHEYNDGWVSYPKPVA